MADHSSQLHTSPFLHHFLNGLPGELADSFSTDQLQAVQHAFGMRYAQHHAIDLRRRIPLPGGKVYVVMLIGRERRGDAAPRAALPYRAIAAVVSVALLLLL
jgi:hypothetical protein